MATRTPKTPRRHAVRAPHRVYLGGRTIEAGDVLDIDESDGSVILAARLATTPAEVAAAFLAPHELTQPDSVPHLRIVR